jgi:hypothetical protein
MQRLPRVAPGRAAIATALAAAVAAAALVPSLASGSAGGAYGPGTGSSVATVYIKGNGKSLKFVAPKTITAGQDLRVLNTTDPSKIGPHTFSLVTKSSIPTTSSARHVCFTKGHICKAIATWHGVKGKGPVKTNPVDAGAPGWDTLGSLTQTGDSWFTGLKPHSSIVQQVTADTSAGPTTIYFMCAIHPWMHGSIEVLPPTGS